MRAARLFKNRTTKLGGMEASIEPPNHIIQHHHHHHKTHLKHESITLLLMTLASCSIVATNAATLTDSNNANNQQPPASGGLQFIMTPDLKPQQQQQGNYNIYTPNPNPIIRNESPKLQMTMLPVATIQQQLLQPLCNLGNDTYQIGERWNPNLPPFGVQVCVQCECIVRERKRCYEAKVTCRRITNECPIIDSCPDGKGPVTIAGQCCKSCQSTNPPEDGAGTGVNPPWASGPQSDQPATTPIPISSSNIAVPTTTTTPTSDRLYGYKNERSKEYQAIITSLPACPRRDDDTGGSQQHQATIGGGSGTGAKQSKMGKKPSNDINGIDSRLAFKSLDPQRGYVSPVKGSRDYNDKQLDDTMRHDHQHPNDVQSGAGSQQNYESTRFAPSFQQQQQNPIITTTKRPTQPMNTPPLANICTLGSDTYQIGEKWNPILPPHGLQVCVQCNCIVRQRKLCYEAKVTCRRINNDCPNIEACPDGQKPITVAGQCCKSCQNNEQNMGVIMTTTIQPERMQKNDRIMREYQTIMRTYPACSRLRDGERLNGGGSGTGSGSNNSTSNANATAPVKRSYRIKINE